MTGENAVALGIVVLEAAVLTTPFLWLGRYLQRQPGLSALFAGWILTVLGCLIAAGIIVAAIRSLLEPA